MSNATYSIHPAVGVARVGNSESFYLAPIELGGLPLECDAKGNLKSKNGHPLEVRNFKRHGQIRRQAARFSIYRWPANGEPEEITLRSPGIKRITWTVHLANKKACWYSWNEVGDLETSPHELPGKMTPRNKAVENRRQLIIDPGPRSLNKPSQRTSFSKTTVPKTYKHANFPLPAAPGQNPIRTLGDMLTDRAGRLLVVGAYGLAHGKDDLTTFTGGDTWFDDVGDGPVTCKVEFEDGSEIVRDAWCIVAPPKFAPQVVSAVTLDDVMCDVAVRHLDLLPGFYRGGFWDKSFKVDFASEVAPILNRPAQLSWVTGRPTPTGSFSANFDPRDASPENKPNRQRFSECFRPAGSSNSLFGPRGVAQAPLVAGNNPVSNQNTSRFLTLTKTQSAILKNWARGAFTVAGAPRSIRGVHQLDRASVGNCAGAPCSPGFEISFNLRNPNLYSAPWRIKHRKRGYAASGLDPEYNETRSTKGCEPGDLTKRLSPPWHSDFFDCGLQPVSLHRGDAVFPENDHPIPPTYAVPWWPAQVPVSVVSGGLSASEQDAAGTGAGTQVQFIRGLNNINDALVGWTYLGFVLNQNQGTHFPESFAEVERNHSEFVASAVAVGDVSNQLVASDTSFVPIYYLKKRQRTVAIRF